MNRREALTALQEGHARWRCESAKLPEGYAMTGRRDGHTVCCLDRDFVHFTAGIRTAHLGYVFVDGRLIPLTDYIVAKTAGLEPAEHGH